jgi:hypothetical protein
VAYDKVEKKKKAPKTQAYAKEMMKYEVEIMRRSSFSKFWTEFLQGFYPKSRMKAPQQQYECA